MHEGSLEQPEEALAARVDDPRFPENGQQRWRPGDRLLGRVDGRRQHRLEVWLVFGGGDGGVGGVADDREDRPLDRLLHRLVRAIDPLPEGEGEVEAVEALLRPQSFRHAPEDLARDDA